MVAVRVWVMMWGLSAEQAHGEGLLPLRGWVWKGGQWKARDEVSFFGFFFWVKHENKCLEGSVLTLCNFGPLETVQNLYALVSEVVSFLVSQKGVTTNIWKVKRITGGTRQAPLLPSDGWEYLNSFAFVNFCKMTSKSCAIFIIPLPHHFPSPQSFCTLSSLKKKADM